MDYKSVMREYNLGPNGGILTASNLFATRFDQVVTLCERRAAEVERLRGHPRSDRDLHVERERAGGDPESFASAFPTCVLYVVDTPRAMNPQAFMSNMLRQVSILYKTRLPLIVVFNKIDVARHETALEWMRDFGASTPRSTTTRPSRRPQPILSLVLDAFYEGCTPRA